MGASSPYFNNLPFAERWMQEVVEVQAGRFELAFKEATLVGLDKLDGIGPKSANKLRERGLLDQRDLLLFMPRKYRRIGHFVSGPDMRYQRVGFAEFIAPVVQVRAPAPGTRQPLSVTVDHGGVHFKLVWFGGMTKSSQLRTMEPGVWLHIRGEVSYERHVAEITHPTIEIVSAMNPLIPQEYFSIEAVYPSIDGVKDASLRRGQLQALGRLLPTLLELVPERLRERRGLPRIVDALRAIHLVEATGDLAEFFDVLRLAKRRLVYEEFYTLQLKLAQDYAAARAASRAPMLDARQLARDMAQALPFKLTRDQRRAMVEILDDMARPQPMRRLLQGDVGSGKTIVALLAAAVAIESGHQAALMAPTDILARQHVKRAVEFMAGLNIPIAFLGGSLGAADRRDALARIASGVARLVIGTHALFQDDVVFHDLGLVMIDEQHKFGVEQRDMLLNKGVDPHLLSMTATPIPRSLAHAVFGDLDLTIIREKPPGRKPVRTELRDRSRAPRVYEYVRERILESGEQAYFVYPMVMASEGVSARQSVVEHAGFLKESYFKDLRVGILHGRLDPMEKEATMSAFAAGELDVLCATTVIEVGVDVANATLIVIDGPEFFGLSQLHQLRGRVGRGEGASMCVLLAGEELNEETYERLSSFAQTEDGFELAEVDLRLRGPGLFLGLRQAGQAEFRFGELHRDAELLLMARRDAREEVLGEAAQLVADEGEL